MIMTEQNFRPVSAKDLITNLQIIKQQLSFSFEIKIKSFSKDIDKICEQESWNKLEKIINYLQKKLNNYLKTNRI